MTVRRHSARAALGALALVLAAAIAPALPAQGAPLARIVGTVADSLRGGPLAGATVVATPLHAGADTVFHGALTDARGAFVLAGLPPGEYVVAADHPLVDSTGIGAPARTVVVRGGDSTLVDLAIPSLSTLHHALCGPAPRDSATGVMLGTVRQVDGAALAGGVIVFSWVDYELDDRRKLVRPRELTASVRADSSGTYRACGLPLERSLFMQAQGGPGAQSGVVEEQIGAAGILRRDISVGTEQAPVPARLAVAPVATPVATPAPAAEVPTGPVLSGEVTTAAGAPIAAAQVTLLGTTHGTITNDRGAFRLAGVPTGTQGLKVIALGYLPTIRRVEVSGATAPVVVRLENVAVVLDSMRVLARRPGSIGGDMANTFEHRRRMGIGRFVTAQQIAAMKALTTTDIFRHVNGVHLATPRGAGSEIVVSNHGPVGFGNTICPVTLFLDGIRVQSDDINMVMPSDLKGVEVHSVSTAPPQFAVSLCGAVFLWTK